MITPSRCQPSQGHWKGVPGFKTPAPSNIKITPSVDVVLITARGWDRSAGGSPVRALGGPEEKSRAKCQRQHPKGSPCASCLAARVQSHPSVSPSRALAALCLAADFGPSAAPSAPRGHAHVGEIKEIDSPMLLLPAKMPNPRSMLDLLRVFPLAAISAAIFILTDWHWLWRHENQSKKIFLEKQRCWRRGRSAH